MNSSYLPGEQEETRPDLLVRLLAWLVRRIGRGTLLVWGLLLLAVSALVSGLTLTVRGLDISTLAPVALAGCVFGWLLARTRINDLFGIALWLAAGLDLVFFRVGSLWQELAALITGLNRLAAAYLSWALGRHIPVATTVWAAFD
jgi:hypothetical protein